MPAALLVGRCIEVWAEPKADSPADSAFRRFAVARGWWLDAAYVDKPTDRDALIPRGTPWSVDYLIETRGQYVAERLAPADATPDDLPRLAAQGGDDLFLAAAAATRQRLDGATSEADGVSQPSSCWLGAMRWSSFQALLKSPCGMKRERNLGESRSPHLLLPPTSPP